MTINVMVVYAHIVTVHEFRPTSNTIKLTEFNWETALQERNSYPIIDQIIGTTTWFEFENHAFVYIVQMWTSDERWRTHLGMSSLP